MDFFKPIKRKFVKRQKADTTLSIPSADENKDAPLPSDSEVVELQGDDAWQQWQDSVFVEEFTNEFQQTMPPASK